MGVRNMRTDEEIEQKILETKLRMRSNPSNVTRQIMGKSILRTLKWIKDGQK